MNRKSRKSRKTRKVSLVLGIAVAALSIGVPTALAEGRMAGTQEPGGVAFFRANEVSTLAQQNVSPVSTYLDPSERGSVVTQDTSQSRDAFETMTPAVIESLYKISAAKSGEFANPGNLSTYTEAGQRAVPQPQSPNVTPTSSDNDIQWPQIGIGLVIALVLVLGIGLAVRTNRMRPAH